MDQVTSECPLACRLQALKPSAWETAPGRTPSLHPGRVPLFGKRMHRLMRNLPHVKTGTGDANCRVRTLLAARSWWRLAFRFRSHATARNGSLGWGEVWVNAQYARGGFYAPHGFNCDQRHLRGRRDDSGGSWRSSLARCRPVLDSQAANAAKLAGIVGYESGVFRQCVARDP